MDDIKDAIISIMDISPEGLTIEQLQKEYESLEHKKLCHGQFGFNSLMELLKSMPSVKVHNNGGHVIIKLGVSDGKADHITELIKRQKKPTKKRKGNKNIDNNTTQFTSFTYRKKYPKNEDHKSRAFGNNNYNSRPDHQNRAFGNNNPRPDHKSRTFGNNNYDPRPDQKYRAFGNNNYDPRRTSTSLDNLGPENSETYSNWRQNSTHSNYLRVETRESFSNRRSDDDKWKGKLYSDKIIEERNHGKHRSNRIYESFTEPAENRKGSTIEEKPKQLNLHVTIDRGNEDSRKVIPYRNGFEKPKLNYDNNLLFDDDVTDVDDHISEDDNEISIDPFTSNAIKSEEICVSSCTPQAMLAKGYEINKQMLLRPSSVIGSDVLDETFDSVNNNDSSRRTNFTVEHHSRPQSADSCATPSPSPSPYSMASFRYTTPPPQSTGPYSAPVLSDDPRRYSVQTLQQIVPYSMPTEHYPVVRRSSSAVQSELSTAHYYRSQSVVPHSAMPVDPHSRPQSVVPQSTFSAVPHSRPQSVVPQLTFSAVPHSRPQSVVPYSTAPAISRSQSVVPNFESSMNQNFRALSVTTVDEHFKNSLPTVDNIILPAVLQFQDEQADGLYFGKLLETAVICDLPEPVYEVYEHRNRRNEPFAFCKIKIGDYSCSSFPNDAKTPAQAREIAAWKAYTYLVNQVRAQTVKKNAPKESQLEGIIVDRIVEIARNSSYGIFVKNLEETYTKRFKDTLADDWLELVKKCPNLIVKDSLGGQIISCSPNILSDSIESLPEIVLPADPDWDIYITCFSSVSSVYFRILGNEYNDAYGDLATEMNEFYQHFQRMLSPADVKTDSYYVALFKDDCFRVQVQDVSVEGKIKCFLIDHGDVDTFTQLFPLVERFAKLPPQAIQATLTDLEETDGVVSNEIIESVAGKSYVVHIDNHDRDNLKLTVYDTSSDDQDINVNELLKAKIRENTLSNKHMTEDMTEVLLTSFLTAEEIYVQPITEKIMYLNKLIVEAANKIDAEKFMYQLMSVSDVVKDNLYLVNYAGDWYRAIVKKVVSKKEIVVQYIDYGYVETSSLDKIVTLNGFAEDLKTIPGQAIKVRLHNKSEMKVDNAALLRVNDIVAENEGLIMKVIDKHGLLPTVELFKESHDHLQSINDYILECNVSQSNKYTTTKNDTTIENGTATSENNAIADNTNTSDNDNTSDNNITVDSKEKQEYSEFCKPLARFNVQQHDRIKVYITLCATPSNFYFQPIKLREKLEELNKNMNEFYEDPTNVVLIPNDIDLKPNNVFACKLNGNWQRVAICKLINTADVSVNLVDFGSVSVTTKDNLRYLYPMFSTLPSVCENSELAGIVPVGGDWDPCAVVMFQKILQNKTFYAIVCGAKHGKLCVRLYDIRANNEVVDVSVQLIEGNYASDLLA